MKIQLKGSRLAFAAIGVLAFGAASAASLGGLTSSNIGADTTVVAACDSDGVSVTYATSYSSGSGEYVVTDVKLAGIDVACDGQKAAVTLKDSAGSALTAGSLTVSGTSETITLINPAAAQKVAGASLIISG